MSVRSFLVASSAVIGSVLAAPAPAPQDIPFDIAYALPNPSYTTDLGATAQTVSYNPTTVYSAAIAQITSTNTVTALDTATTVPADASGAQKRAAETACTSQASGYGPVPSPDSPSAFLALNSFASSASAAPVPTGYTQTFQNLQASNNAYGYLGYTTLQTYDSQACANKCNKINGCISFNIYFERDPTVDPGTGNSGCANPPSTTQIKCVFWGGPVDTDNALNVGQWRNQFQVVIAGSNGYVNNTVAQVPGYGMANPLGHAAINAPYDAYGFDSYMGSAMFVGAFDAQLCADACTQKSNYAIAHPPTDGTPVQTCQFFNTYILYINTTKNIQGQVCAMYSESWPASYATNVGQYRGNDHFLLEYSFSYSNATNPGSTNPVAAVYQAKKDILWPANSAQPYCSSILGYTTPLTTSTVFATATTTTTTTATTVTTQGARVAAGKRAPMAGMDLAPRDSVAIPNVLTKYPASIVTSACSLAVTPVTQTSVVLTTTTATTVPATTTTTTTVTTSPAAVPTHAIVEIAQTDGYNWWGVSDVPCNNDESAYLLEGYPGAEYGDTFQLLGPGQPITVVSTNVNAPDVGDTMYYDPTNAFYGPAGGAGVASFLTAVSSSDSNTASTLPINCSVDGNGNLQCLWANTGVNGDWWFCRGIVTLVAPGHDLSQNAECQEGLVYKLLNLEWQGTN